MLPGNHEAAMCGTLSWVNPTRDNHSLVLVRQQPHRYPTTVPPGEEQ